MLTSIFSTLYIYTCDYCIDPIASLFSSVLSFEIKDGKTETIILNKESGKLIADGILDVSDEPDDSLVVYNKHFTVADTEFAIMSSSPDCLDHGFMSSNDLRQKTKTHAQLGILYASVNGLTDITDALKKYSGPLGNFYGHPFSTNWLPAIIDDLPEAIDTIQVITSHGDIYNLKMGDEIIIE